MENLEIRLLVEESGLTYKEIAAVMGISRFHLCRLMAKKLTPKNWNRITAAIDKAKGMKS